MDLAWTDVDAVYGEPEGATSAALLLAVVFVVASFGRGEDVGAYQEGVLAPEEGSVGWLGECGGWCVGGRGKCVRRGACRARGDAMPTSWR
ncbi:hypothetical protein [Streptomyces acidicola]|uniref:hypothetical protein n=1 Tax=Streptomyces acidicola TaxID=2596892 RepID=UPI0037F54536